MIAHLATGTDAEIALRRQRLLRAASDFDAATIVTTAEGFTTNGVVQGFVEGSNVNPIMEMTKMITVTRAFDGINAATEKSESSMTDAIKTLGQAG